MAAESRTILQSPLVNPQAFTDVVGMANDAGRMGVIGSNPATNAFGFLAGRDLAFSQHVGVYGQSDQQGVMGLTTADAGTGVYGGAVSRPGAPASACIGVRGETFSGAGVQGTSFGAGVGLRGQSASGVGIVAKGGQLAARFEGDVEVTGDIRLANADCAEDFDIADITGSEPGSVMVLDDQGSLRPSNGAYDTRVAGVISGAGAYRPGIVLDRKGSTTGRLPVALLGKVYCNVDADEHPIRVGDLLTTATFPGHAMRAVDQTRAFGAVIGKALRPLASGRGQIPILIALQ